ncbi:hypothetical protein, partial [Blastococcus sp. URHD0036]|uniref:LEM-3-like GIY-YIG domain-containing protein n=1 Tax=Blastococcus sp. URHD0036 TaxID=1380356 RepID=UPI0004972947
MSSFALPHQFSSYVSEQLKFYVYVLRDPRDGEVFYVGKGVGNRVFAHAQAALVANADTQVSLKLDRIRAIHEAGHAVRTEILRFGLTSREAYEVEAVAIQLLQQPPKAELTNLVSGHHVGARGWMSTAEAISVFEAPPAPDITEPVLMIKPSQGWYPGMSDEELFEVTHGWWKLSRTRAVGAKYVLSVSRGVVRAVYAPAEWRAQGPGDRGFEEGSAGGSTRWGFSGASATGAFAAGVLGTDVTRYFAQGAQNPVAYLNC